MRLTISQVCPHAEETILVFCLSVVAYTAGCIRIGLEPRMSDGVPGVAAVLGSG